ncbi:MAG: tetratricopeptide repeat protein [Candidatus Riflebacteria bacterium]|nr:tetratricopeptide repeat protein [Candidatus Riflebacteria bacterium]
MNISKTLGEKGSFWLPVLACLLTAVVFFPCLSNGFTNWDDPVYLLNNPQIRSLSLNNLQSFFSSYFVGSYIPLTMTAFAVQYHLWGLDPFFFHLVNYILHILNVLLVFCLFLSLSREPFPAFLTAVLWGIHPLRVESVAWVIELKDVLSIFFFLSASNIWVRAVERTRAVHLQVLVLFLLALFSKGQTVTFPIVALLLNYLKGEKLTKKTCLEVSHLFLISLVFGIIGYYGQNLQLDEDYSIGFLLHLKQFLSLISFYLGMIFYPINLCAFYPPSDDFIDYSGFLILLTLSPIIIMYWKNLRSQQNDLPDKHSNDHSDELSVIITEKFTEKLSPNRVTFFSFSFFFFNILFFLRIVLVGEAIAADRFTYVASIGISFLVASIVTHFFELSGSFKVKALSFCAITVIILLLSFLSWERCQVWSDSISLWSDTINKSNPKHYVPYLSRATAYFNAGKLDKVEPDLIKATSFAPDFFGVYLNIGTLKMAQEKLDEAKDAFQKALKLKPSDNSALRSLGQIFLSKKEYKTAEKYLTLACRMYPMVSDNFLIRAMFFYQTNEFEKAFSDIQTADNLFPDAAQVLILRGKIYKKLGKSDLSETDFIRAQQILKEQSQGLKAKPE